VEGLPWFCTACIPDNSIRGWWVDAYPLVVFCNHFLPVFANNHTSNLLGNFKFQLSSKAEADAQGISPEIKAVTFKKFWEINWWLLIITIILTTAPNFIGFFIAGIYGAIIGLIISLIAFISGVYAITKRSIQVSSGEALLSQVANIEIQGVKKEQ
jgi:Na+/H+ antiporter NhaC